MGAQSLRRTSEFRRAFREGKAVAGDYVVVHAVPNGLGVVRVGYPVGKRMGGAVKRNRIKRLLREAVRGSAVLPSRGYDFVVVPRRRMTSPGLRCQDVMRDLDRVLERLGPYCVREMKPALCAKQQEETDDAEKG